MPELAIFIVAKHNPGSLKGAPTGHMHLKIAPELNYGEDRMAMLDSEGSSGE